MCISDNSKEEASSHSGSTTDADSNGGKELELDMPQKLPEGSTEQLDSALDDKLKPDNIIQAIQNPLETQWQGFKIVGDNIDKIFDHPCKD